MLYAFFWVIPQCLNFICQHFGNPSSYLPAYEDGTECSETSAYKIQMPRNYPEESIQHLLFNSVISVISHDISFVVN